LLSVANLEDSLWVDVESLEEDKPGPRVGDKALKRMSGNVLKTKKKN